MQQNCPDCNTELVSSAVGMLCPGCGALHQFEKMSSTGAAVAVHTSTQPALTVHDMVKPTVSKPAKIPKPKKPTHSKPATTKAEPAKPTKYSLKRHMKRLMVPELPAPHVSDYSHDSHIADTDLAPAAAVSAAPNQVTDISRKYDETFVPDETAKTAAVAASAVTVSHKQSENAAQPSPDATNDEWKEGIDDSPSSFVISRSIIMIVAAILLLVAAYLAVFWFRVV